MAREPDAAAHRCAKIERVRLLDLRHGVDRDDQRQIVDGGIAERLCRGFDPHLKAFRLEPAADHRGTEIGIVSRPAAPNNHCLAHVLGPQSICPVSRPAGSIAGRSTRFSILTRRPSSAEVWNASITSSTWKASAPLARCGRLFRIAEAMSATPMERNSPST